MQRRCSSLLPRPTAQARGGRRRITCRFAFLEIGCAETVPAVCGGPQFSLEKCVFRAGKTKFSRGLRPDPRVGRATRIASWPHPIPKCYTSAQRDRVAMALLLERRCSSRAVWWGQAWWKCVHYDAEGYPARRAHFDGGTPSRLDYCVIVDLPGRMEACSLKIDSLNPLGFGPPSAYGRRVSGSPRAVGWRQGSLPAPASDMAAAALLVHCRRAARPPSLHPIGPEGASLSALSLPDPHPTLARAGVLLVAAAARRPPICHRPQPGADKPWRRRRRRRSWHC